MCPLPFTNTIENMPTDKQNKPVSYYDVLHVKPDASDAEVKKKYRMLAKIFHPDRNPKDRRMAEHRFRLINEAYSHLKTHERRTQYNRQLNLQKADKQGALLEAENDNTNARNWLTSFADIFWPAATRVKSAGNKNHG
ncbi:MAG: hypothetical protein DHS20C02_09740 [Micavibrio sp.]|nr:MAG: hypothetical protein DHS20C02_09740 [Micavibrio sp.]